MQHQPAALGQGAGSALLTHLGFTAVSRDQHGTVTSATPTQVPGYIMTRFADKYGRAVAFAFAGTPPESVSDGALTFLDVKHMRASANYLLLDSGLVYPTFYSLLYVDLRRAMAKAAVKARKAGLGVWASDVTRVGFELISRKQLQDDLVILPKIFRRLIDYLGLDETGGASLAGFAHYLDTRDDRLFTVPDGHSTEFATLATVTGQHLALTRDPEDIIFIEG